jgi:hypothetical protein
MRSHSRKLNRLGDAWDRRVADPWEVSELVRSDLKSGFELAYEHAISRTSVGKFLDRLGSAFRENQNEPSDMSIEERRLFQVFQHQRELFRYRLMDELSYDLVRLLEQGAELDEPPTHVLADEYQDFTAGELRLLQLLAERSDTVIDACGDDRQRSLASAQPIRSRFTASLRSTGSSDPTIFGARRVVHSGSATSQIDWPRRSQCFQGLSAPSSSRGKGGRTLASSTSSPLRVRSPRHAGWFAAVASSSTVACGRTRSWSSFRGTSTTSSVT